VNQYTDEDVITALDLRADPDPYDGVKKLARAKPDFVSAETPDGCVINVVMANKQDVALYTSAGDAVATNPAAGVKFEDKPGCGAKLAAALKTLK